jgi:cytoskeletal protein CcmA (bactofilin family)
VDEVSRAGDNAMAMKLPLKGHSDRELGTEPSLKQDWAGEDRAKSISIPEVNRQPISVEYRPYAASSEKNKLLSIGEGVRFAGKVLEADSVVLQGTAEGEIKARSLEISATGSLTGTVSADTMTVAGTFSGDALVVGALIVASSGYIDGKISYGSLSVERGGVVLGTLEQVKAVPSKPTTADQASASSAAGLTL